MITVLIVDDRAADRELLATALGHAGYTVLEAATGQAAIAIALTQSPNLIIADIVMPTMDGYELVQALRSDPRTAPIPVIFSTATYVATEVRRLAAACGVVHVLIKPSESPEIIRVVVEALESVPDPLPPLAGAEFHREHLRVLNAKLVQKLGELEAAERRTAESLTLLETLQSSAPVGFGFVDRDLRMGQMNEMLAAMTGGSVAEQLGGHVRDVFAAVWSELEPVYQQVLETGKPVLNQRVKAEHAGVPPATRIWLASYYPVRLDDETIGIGIVVVDITDDHQAEEFSSVVLDNMAEGLYVLDRDNRLVLVNAAASKLLGWSEDELRGQPVHSTIHYQHADGSPHREEDSKLLKAHTEGLAIRSLDDAFTRKDGSILPVAYSGAPLLSGGNVRGSVVVFRDITAEKAEETRVRRDLNSLTWLGRIRDALDDERLVLYSQPIVPLTGGQRGEELLLRMIGSNDQIIPPESFLPTAEKYGLIGEIDLWVVTQAIRLAAGGRSTAVNLNLSGASVGDPGLLATIEQQLHETGADASNVVFEITETALMRDIDAGEAFARGLADLGCGVALDDFGTGFGSFTYLKRLPIQYLKIDVEFVRELIPKPDNQHVVKAIVSLARGFGQQTIAEGVEDAETLALLRDYGIDHAQGYHLGRPTPLDAVSLVATRPLKGSNAATPQATWSRDH